MSWSNYVVVPFPAGLVKTCPEEAAFAVGLGSERAVVFLITGHYSERTAGEATDSNPISIGGAREGGRRGGSN